MAYASRAMRSLLVDMARERMAQKRSAELMPLTLGADVPDLAGTPEQLVALDEALTRLGNRGRAPDAGRGAARDHGTGGGRGGRGARRLRADGQARLATRQGLSARGARGHAVSDVEALDWLDRLLAADETTAPRLAGDTGRTTIPDCTRACERLLASGAVARALPCPRARRSLDGLARLNVDATRTLQPGDVLAGYRLIRELGRGGMSVVWLAERADGVVKRKVALKMPMFMLQGAATWSASRASATRWRRSSHPNVARLYDAGVLPSGQPFIVLEHVDGVPLNASLRCAAARSCARGCGCSCRCSRAVEHAHKHLIVHRDLKPSNILVDAEGPGEAARLRHRQAAGRERGRGAADASGRRGHDAAVRGARAVARRDHLHAHRCVFARRGAARAADAAALPYRGAGVPRLAGRSARAP